jgi:hypothetical protein
MQIWIWAKMTASSEFQVAFLSGTYYYTNVKPYFTFEWLKSLSLPHTCHKPRSYCWRQNPILLYCNKQSLEVGISTWYQHVTSSFFWQKKTSIYSKPSFLAWSWWAKDMARKGSPTIDWLIYPVIFFPVKIHTSCSQIFTKPRNNASMSNPKKIIWF